MSRRFRSGPLISAVVILALVPALVVLARPRDAGASVTLAVRPAIVELSAKPGGAGRQEIAVANGGDEAIDVTVAVAPYKAATGDRSAVDWLTAEPAAFRLDPGTSQTVEVGIEIPDDLPSGGRYATVTFTTGAGTVAGSGAALAGQVGVAFLVTVDGEGELTERIALDRFEPVLESDGRVGFVALVRNEGNIHTRPAGVVNVGDAVGELFASLEIADSSTLLPGGEALLGARGSLPLDPAGRYRAEATVDYGRAEPVIAIAEFTPRAALSVAPPRVCENLDRGPTIAVDLRNEGEMGLRPVVHYAIEAAGGAAPSGATLPADGVLWPGEGGSVRVDHPDRLVSGDYLLAVRVDYAAPAGDGQTVLPPVEHEVPFRIGGLGEGAAPLCAS